MRDSSLELDLKDYAAIVWKRKWLIAVCVIVGCLAAGLYNYFFTNPNFIASSKIIVNQSKESKDLAGQLSINEVNLNIQLVNTYKEIIKTYAVMDRVAQQHPELGLTAEQLIGRIQVGTVNDSQVMTLAIQDQSYDNAINTVNAVAAVFKETIPTIMSVDNVEILSEAKIAYDVSPNPLKFIIVGLIAALIISVGMSFLLEYLDDTVRSEADIAGLLGVPTFAAVPVITRKDLISRQEKRSKPEAEGATYATVNS
ncbi:Wzz/FepE/Etk N-terminal domain-containing protein [Paenibacillus timonensis]|uniref:YveK family protein n=1 Tax=Paenibacillus timonensis TaxID=225915 RepID=A0ABW3SAC8_9BACL|nr:Wzz/FepE/Etk N-terminal domain-containing protein [Paenibacillus timonensis]MCH1640127.1 Wzz/FepE/Etk N-terminal domain-containing protein [Paenibacillus timonensis]